MGDQTVSVDLSADVVELTAALCDVASVSGDEAPLADAVEVALAAHKHLHVDRDGDTVVARTYLGRDRRVVIAGHLDTVPFARFGDRARNFPTWREGAGSDETLWGRGTVDMKGGLAMLLACAAAVPEPVYDVTYVCYDNEEVESAKNGLGRVVRNHPDWLAADFAVLGEPTNGAVEGGCNGTMRVVARTTGVAAHSARAWRGDNAIHKLAPLLTKLAAADAGSVEVDGLTYRQSLSAVAVSGGIAGNVIPDAASVTINYRFAPSTSVDQAEAFLRDLCAGYEVEVTDAAPGARPGLGDPTAAAFVAATGRPAEAKVGWTDVSRFAELGIPAINFGPGDPLLAHRDDEHVACDQIRSCARVLAAWLRGDSTPAR